MASRRPFAALLVASGSFVVVLDTFAAAVAFPRIEEAFPDTPRTTLAWMSSGYSIALAALLLTAGKLGDRYGRRRVYMSGMAGFAVMAVLSATALTPAWLIGARVLQGCAGAMMISTSVALALMEYPPERRGLAMGWLGVMGSLASLAGPVLAGNIIDIGGSWRWVFLVSLPIAIAVLITAPRYLQEAKAESEVGQPIDLLGVVLGIGASGLLTLGVLQSGEWGLTDPRTLGIVAVALLLGALFVWRCSTFRAPLLRLDIFRHRRFTIATVNQLGSQFAIFAFFFWMPLFLINVWGWSAAGVGWAVADTARHVDELGADRALRRPPRLPGRARRRRPVRRRRPGVVLPGRRRRSRRSGASSSPALLLFGWGIGMVGITSASAALAGLEAEELAMANSMFQTTRRLVQTLGIASVVAILGDRSADSLELFQRVWLVTGVGFLISVVVALWYPANRLRGTEPPAPVAHPPRQITVIPPARARPGS